MSLNAGHYLVRCSCGTVIEQCRCVGQKIELIKVRGCQQCQERDRQLAKKEE